jgi:hypothetical protein
VTKGKRSSEPDVPSPERDVPDPSPRYDAMQVLQTMMELQKDLATANTKTDRLITDLSTLTTKVGDISNTLFWAKGFAFAAVILIPVCATIIWWLVGGKLEQMRDDLLGIKKPPAILEQVNPHH